MLFILVPVDLLSSALKKRQNKFLSCYDCAANRFFLDFALICLVYLLINLLFYL